MADKIKRLIEKSLVISTIYLSQKDQKLLEDNCNGVSNTDTLCIHKYEYGYLIHTGIDNEYFNNYSKLFNKIINIGRKKDCAYINYDCEGPEYDDLDKYISQ